MKDASKSEGKCLICDHPGGSSPHFGSFSCLACAAFFRRTVALNITFECKKDRECTIYHELRMICRACRFEKCLQAGMNRDYVQKRRNYKKKDKKTSNNSDDEKECKESPISLKKEEPDDGFPSDVCQKEASTSSATTSLPPSPEFLNTIGGRSNTPSEQRFELVGMTGLDTLRHYVDELKKAMDRRRMLFTDTAMLVILDDSGDMPFDARSPPPHSWARQYEAQKVDNLLAMEFCKATPGFDSFDKMERAMFFRMTLIMHAMLDVAWITAKVYPTDPEPAVVMYTDGSICTVNEFSIGWEDEEGLPLGEKKKLFHSFVKRLYDSICVPFRKLKIDLVEYASLRAVCIWKLGYCEYSNKVKEIGREHTAALLVGLHAYYEDIYDTETEVAERVGNVMLMMGSISEMIQVVMEMYKSAELFELFKVDALSKFLLRI